MNNLTFEINPNHKLMAQLNDTRKHNSQLAKLIVRQIFDNCCVDGHIDLVRKDSTQRINQILGLLMSGEHASPKDQEAIRK